jgi:hypothetical protein
MKLVEYLADPKTPASVRAFLDAAFADPPPASGLPPLFGTLKRDFSGRGAGGEVIKMKAGERARVVDVGRFGDVGITLILDETKLYQARAVLAELTDFSAAASASR